MNIRVISDERSAAYVALGMAQHLKSPVILICTSGTSVLNYGPAVAEAYYRNIPLLMITADRPPEWVDQKDGQTVRQQDVFQNHVKASFNLPMVDQHPDSSWYLERVVNEAIHTCKRDNMGPVHINVPLREPLYPAKNEVWEYKLQHPIIVKDATTKDLFSSKWETLINQLQASKRPLILGGQQSLDPCLDQFVQAFSEKFQIPVLGDSISNLHHIPKNINLLEVILGQEESKLADLQPDLLITFGGAVISKNLKLFLRECSTMNHWHLQEAGYPADTFKSLTEVLAIEAQNFFKTFINKIDSINYQAWYDRWQTEQEQAAAFLATFCQDQPYSEMKSVTTLLDMLPRCKLHVSNSMPVRWVDLLGVRPEIIEVAANRGTSGIDGCTSTAVGQAMVDPSMQVLLSGDMAFFYDRNAFWHNYPLPNLKVIVLNNQGGGIFRLIDGPSRQPECADLFVTEQHLTAQSLAGEYGFKYLHCTQEEELIPRLSELFEPHECVSILEIALPDNMESIYKDLKNRIRQDYE